MTMNPSLAANLAVLEEVYDALVEFVRPLDDAVLNWTPGPGDANSVAALVTHTAGSVDSWLARAIGEPIVRDRAAEFQARADSASLVAVVERSRAESKRRFAVLESTDLEASQQVRRQSRNEEASVTAAWCIEHALIHAGEHWGQIQLTRQIYPG